MKTHSTVTDRTVCDARLKAEELEAVIAPRVGVNHNETILQIEELEPLVAPSACWGS